MNSIISLINFLLLYSLNRSHYDKVIFLLVLRMLYIENYKKQLYISLYNSSHSKSSKLSHNNTLKKNDIEQSTIPNINTGTNNFTLHNNSNSLSTSHINTIKTSFYNEDINCINYDNIDNYKLDKKNDTKLEYPSIDNTIYESSNHNISDKTTMEISEKTSDNSNTNMTYDLDSLLQFLMPYSRNIPNYDNLLTVLFILNYYIRFILYPSISNQINVDDKLELEKNDSSNEISNDSISKSTDLSENLNSKDKHISYEPNTNKHHTENLINDSTLDLDIKTITKNTKSDYIPDHIELSKINSSNTSIPTTNNSKSPLVNKSSIHKEKYSYDVTSTIKQIPFPNKIAVLKSDFNRTTPIHASDSNSELKKKVSVLLASCKINDLFKGELIFFNNIVDVTNITNMVFINEATLIVDIRNNNYIGTLFLTGYIKTILDSLVPISHSSNLVSSAYRNNIIFTPFSISENITLPFNSFEKPTVYNNLEIDITKISSNSDRILKNSKKINDYIYFYNKCELILEIDYIINIYKSEDILI